VRQIELALERLRWLPVLGPQRLIAINIPMFRLWAWESGTSRRDPSFGVNVIVGRAMRTRTPVFVEQMREVIFRPFWNVPPSIARHEIVPLLERDPDYLRRQQMEIVRGPGDDALRYAIHDRVLRQVPVASRDGVELEALNLAARRRARSRGVRRGSRSP